MFMYSGKLQMTCHVKPAGLSLTLNVQADDGYLYPLERAFFYVHKPPLLIVFDEIASVEFMRQGGGLIAASAKTFDLNVRQRNDQVRASISRPHFF